MSGEKLENQSNSLSVILENMNLAKDGKLNIAGALLFAKTPQYRLPAFVAKCVRYPGEDLGSTSYLESLEAVGRMADIFQQCLNFLSRNTPRIQARQDVNSLGKPLVDSVVYQELLANALIHRDYFIIAPVRIIVFNDRIEIISPGHLPNNLNVQNILNGNSNIRNPVLASFATRILPYRGLGSGIRRALNAYPHINFIDDREGNLFKAVIDLKAGISA
jgi:ATP-dependent DNA helicase RecG